MSTLGEVKIKDCGARHKAEKALNVTPGECVCFLKLPFSIGGIILGNKPRNAGEGKIFGKEIDALCAAFSIKQTIHLAKIEEHDQINLTFPRL